MGFARRDNIIIRLVLLEHQPHSFNVFPCKTPISLSIEISHINLIVQTAFDTGDSAAYLTSYKRLSAPRGFMVEQDSVTGKHPIAFSVVDRDPVRIDFSRSIGATRIK